MFQRDKIAKLFLDTGVESSCSASSTTTTGNNKQPTCLLSFHLRVMAMSKYEQLNGPNENDSSNF